MFTAKNISSPAALFLFVPHKITASLGCTLLASLKALAQFLNKNSSKTLRSKTQISIYFFKASILYG